MGRYPEEKVTFWCYDRKQGEELKAAAPVPCRKGSCERYRTEYPYCVMMEIRGKRGRIIE